MNILILNEPFPVIDLGDIVLRELTPHDAKDYFNFMSNPIMRSFVTADNIPDSVSAAVVELQYWASLFKNKRSIYWAIALKDKNKLIGTAGFNVISMKNSRADISYDLDPEYWGRGVMTRSIQAILDFAKNPFELVRIQANVIADNERSIKVLERLGFSKDGFMQKYEVVDGTHRDYYLYGKVLV